ncbi:hypothetical protein [Streptomyces anulatus]|uniref:hypothetical protein n=1 Tax=Streptomyces anulatus TaxID=1892 RepID=UPI002E0D7D80|nr:hypothetical protein OG557_13465 [Streptomyces anulatus]
MNARRVSAAAGVICAAQKTRQTPAGIAAALEAAGLLQSPESAAELVALRKRVAELEAATESRPPQKGDHVQLPDGSTRRVERTWMSGRDLRLELDNGLSRFAAAVTVVPAPVEDPHDSPLHHTYALGRDLPEVKPEPPAVTAERWNARYPIGTPVTAYPGCRPEDDPKCTQLTTRTRSAAAVLGDHTAVVWVDGHSACISLTHVDPRTETGGAL